MFKFKRDVYVKKGNYGWTANYIDNDVFYELRPENGEDLPNVEGYYEVVSERGFKRYTGKTGKVSVYGNGKCIFTPVSQMDEDLSEELEI